MAGVAARALGPMALDEEARVDPLDGSSFTLRELVAMHEVLGSKVERQALEAYWRGTCQPLGGEQRVDPADGEALTLAELCKKYAGSFDNAQCAAYFRTVMPRPCPRPSKGLSSFAAAAQTGIGTSSPSASSRGARKVVVPFAAAALWSVALPEVAACVGELHQTENPFAVVSAWRYAVNNLRLAIGQLPPREAIKHWFPLLGVRRAQAALEAFSRKPSPEAFTLAAGCVKAALGAFQEWLQSQPPTEAAIPDSITLDLPFLLGGSSATLPSTAAAARVTLSNGVEVPLLGFGTWQLLGDQAYQATLTALQTGYRHIDTAQCYSNEAQVGRAIRDSGVPRREVFLSTKLSDPAAFGHGVRLSFIAQLQNLGVDYVDLYMLHQPADQKSTHAAWRELEELHAEGMVRALGVSNFGLRELQDLLKVAKVKPVYLQNKMNVYAIGEQRVSGGPSVLAFAKEHAMQCFGYSVNNPWPGVLRPMEDPHVMAIAERYGRTAAQVLLRWALQLGVGVLPKASSKARIEENFELFDFSLADADMRLLTGLATLACSAGGLREPEWVQDVYALASLDP